MKQMTGKSRHPRRSNDRGRVPVRTAKGRRASSTRWLDRQLNDPYVRQAAQDGYRSRSAYKLIDLNERCGFLKSGMTVVDLGSAPGGWSQVAARIVNSTGPETARGRVIACDIRGMEPIDGVEFLMLDMREAEAPARLTETCDGLVNAVISDMAAAATGHAGTDHIRVTGLCEAALDLAESILKPGGSFVAKVLDGGAGSELQLRISLAFRQVRTVKPAASRKESSEKYLVATGFRNRPVI